MSDSVPTKEQDPARKHATPVSSKPGSWVCNYCKKITSGGVQRAKQHIVGGYKNVTACTMVSDHIKEEVRSFMLKKAEAKATTQMMPPPPNLYDEYEEDEDEGQTSKPPPSKKRKGPMDKYVCPTPPDVLKGRKDKKEVFGKSDKELRDRACAEIARWFYDASLPFNAVNYDSFKSSLELVGQYGSGFKPPTMYELRVPFLKKEVKETEKQLVEHKTEWSSKGC
ncbi:PREDICTED: uncharacterized protein LOC109130606 [Camelina sativa]|uniref:Uncharacterized protein LOC109130606 n=1 Tax=Camelina sativa TaxID=90675 RepID=A0ABM1RA31_CAMSA|nr:PREDICTED: uncharacterized protein LOC109130606 [Camelina sativa]